MNALDDRRFAGSEIIVSGPKSARHAGVASFVDQDAGLDGKLDKTGEWLRTPKTHPLEIPVNHSLAMDVDQPPGDASQL